MNIDSMHGFRTTTEGNHVTVTRGRHTPAGYEVDEAWTVSVRPGHRHLNLQRVAGLLTDQLRMATLRGEPVGLRRVCDAIERENLSYPGSTLTVVS